MQKQRLYNIKACVFDAYGTLFDFTPEGEMSDLSSLPDLVFSSAQP